METQQPQLKIYSAKTNEEIKFSFRRITNREFEKALGLLEDSSQDKSLSRSERLSKRDEAFKILVDGDAVLEEATRGDLQKVFDAAIEFNQVSESDRKKSD